MARVEKIICDRCGRETTDEHQINMRAQDKTLEVDLCGVCFQRIASDVYIRLRNQKGHRGNYI